MLCSKYSNSNNKTNTIIVTHKIVEIFLSVLSKNHQHVILMGYGDFYFSFCFIHYSKLFLKVILQYYGFITWQPGFPTVMLLLLSID